MDAGDHDGYLMTVDSITALPDECPASYNDGDDGSSWCGDRRDCNAPAAYSSLTVNDDNEPLYVIDGLPRGAAGRRRDRRRHSRQACSTRKPDTF